MKYENFNKKIIELIGGKDNVQAVVHCMTRLRFTLKDPSIAKTEEIKQIDGVIDVISNKVAYQIIVGTHVKDVYAELISMLGIESSENSPETKVKKNVFKAILDLVSESMTPVLEPIIAAGMLAGVLSLVALTGLISAESPTYVVLDSIRTAIFFFLPVFMAMSCAKRLNASPYLAVALAVTLLSVSINGVSGLSIFGIQLPTITYSNSFIPILIATWFMGHVQTFLKKVIPSFFHYFLIPVFTLIICLPITLLIFGPIGIWIGEAISMLCTFMMNTFGNWSVVAFYAAIQPFLIMMGAGNFIMPIVMSFLAEMGYDPIFLAACTISDIAVGGAMLGYFLRAKDPKQKQLFGTVSFSAIMGVTEPAVFGAFVKYRRPFFAVMIGGGLGGLFAGLMHVKTYTMAWGLAGLPSYIGNNDFSNLYFMIGAVAIGFVGAAIAGYILGIPEEKKEKVIETIENTETEKTSVKDEALLKKQALLSVAEGKLVPLSEVEDKAFSTGALGKGIGIKPLNNKVIAPEDGEVTCVFPTKHAIGFTTNSGVELLIHIGVDTVQLDGKHFETFVNQGDKVKKGQLLVEADFEKIEKEGYNTTIMVVVTNTDQFLDIIPTEPKNLTVDDTCMMVVL